MSLHTKIRDLRQALKYRENVLSEVNQSLGAADTLRAQYLRDWQNERKEHDLSRAALRLAEHNLEHEKTVRSQLQQACDELKFQLEEVQRTLYLAKMQSHADTAEMNRQKGRSDLLRELLTDVGAVPAHKAERPAPPPPGVWPSGNERARALDEECREAATQELIASRR